MARPEMLQSVLRSLVLGYRPLWNHERRLAGIELYAHAHVQEGMLPPDGAHLLRTMRELWSSTSPPVLIAAQTRQLLCSLLDHPERVAPWIEVRDHWLQDAEVLARVQAAHRRGLKLVWRGDMGREPAPDILDCFDHCLLSIPPEFALAALQSAPGASPLPARQMFENVPSRALVAHCFDQCDALALAGWPAEDVVYSLRHQPLQPAHEVVLALLKAIDQEQSIETFEDILSRDPILAYRFLTHVNSAAFGLRTGISSLRRGLVLMGYGTLQKWLAQQLPHADTEPDLRPVRESMVMRAELTSRLLDAGVENDLRREVYLCGLFSQLDLLLGEPLGAILRRIPLSDRIYDANVLHTGPYAPPLEMACALETEDAQAILQLCETHEYDLEDVNRCLLRMLADLEVKHA